MVDWNQRARPDQRWVCGACGKYTQIGAHRESLRDTSCIMHAVLCQAERGSDGLWKPVDENEDEWSDVK